MHKQCRPERPTARPRKRRKRSTVGQLGRLPQQPTAALPGTPDKVAVMAERAARGESLFHPQDATLDGDWALIVVPSQNRPTARHRSDQPAHSRRAPLDY
jgi:hypothetical protein